MILLAVIHSEHCQICFIFTVRLSSVEHYFCVCSECSDQEFSCSVDPHFSKQKEYPCKVVDKHLFMYIVNLIQTKGFYLPMSRCLFRCSVFHRLIERYTRPEHQLTASLKEMIIKPLL